MLCYIEEKVLRDFKIKLSTDVNESEALQCIKFSKKGAVLIIPSQNVIQFAIPFQGCLEVKHPVSFSIFRPSAVPSFERTVPTVPEKFIQLYTVLAKFCKLACPHRLASFCRCVRRNEYLQPIPTRCGAGLSAKHLHRKEVTVLSRYRSARRPAGQ